jgi:hypothetical protein
MVRKDAYLFSLTAANGSILLGNDHGFGLCNHDYCFLHDGELSPAGATPQPLVSTAERAFLAVSQLTALSPC